jgi:DNA-directed RNA polymerase subunit RPC12/RpoP
MIQPTLNQSTRSVNIKCFICKEQKFISLKKWEVKKDLRCPTCNKKEIVFN